MKIRKFKRNEVTVYNPDGVVLCSADEYTIMDIQIQIAEQKLKGYYYTFETPDGEILRGTINENGELSEWFSRMFDLTQILFSKLYNVRKGTYQNELEERLNEIIEEEYEI
jgi:hypothetical protein